MASWATMPPNNTPVQGILTPQQPSKLRRWQTKSGRVVTSVYRRYPKPPYSYTGMTIMAILRSPTRMLTASAIKEELTKMFPFFRGSYKGWRDTIRHGLSQHPCFVSVPKNPDAPFSTKCSLWTVDMSKVKQSDFKLQRRPSDEMFGYAEDLRDELKRRHGGPIVSVRDEPAHTGSEIEVAVTKMKEKAGDSTLDHATHGFIGMISTLKEEYSQNTSKKTDEDDVDVASHQIQFAQPHHQDHLHLPLNASVFCQPWRTEVPSVTPHVALFNDATPTQNEESQSSADETDDDEEIGHGQQLHLSQPHSQDLYNPRNTQLQAPVFHQPWRTVIPSATSHATGFDDVSPTRNEEDESSSSDDTDDDEEIVQCQQPSLGQPLDLRSHMKFDDRSGASLHRPVFHQPWRNDDCSTISSAPMENDHLVQPSRPAPSMMSWGVWKFEGEPETSREIKPTANAGENGSLSSSLGYEIPHPVPAVSGQVYRSADVYPTNFEYSPSSEMSQPYYSYPQPNSCVTAGGAHQFRNVYPWYACGGSYEVNRNILPSQQNILPSQQNILPSQQHILQSQMNIQPSEQYIPPSQQNILTSQQQIQPSQPNFLLSQQIQPWPCHQNVLPSQVYDSQGSSLHIGYATPNPVHETKPASLTSQFDDTIGDSFNRSSESGGSDCYTEGSSDSSVLGDSFENKHHQFTENVFRTSMLKMECTNSASDGWHAENGSEDQLAAIEVHQDKYSEAVETWDEESAASSYGMSDGSQKPTDAPKTELDIGFQYENPLDFFASFVTSHGHGGMFK